MSEARRFAHRLALALGKSLAELDLAVTPEEFVQWQRYHREEPFGTPKWDIARLAALLISPHMKKGRRVKAQDVFPELKPREPPQGGLARMFRYLKTQGMADGKK